MISGASEEELDIAIDRADLLLEIHKLNNILNDFDKFLENRLKDTYANNDMAKGYKNAIKLCKYYLQELKEGKK